MHSCSLRNINVCTILFYFYFIFTQQQWRWDQFYNRRVSWPIAEGVNNSHNVTSLSTFIRLGHFAQVHVANISFYVFLHCLLSSCVRLLALCHFKCHHRRLQLKGQCRFIVYLWWPVPVRVTDFVCLLKRQALMYLNRIVWRVECKISTALHQWPPQFVVWGPLSPSLTLSLPLTSKIFWR